MTTNEMQNASTLSTPALITPPASQAGSLQMVEAGTQPGGEPPQVLALPESQQVWLDALTHRARQAFSSGLTGTQLAHDAYDVAAWQAAQGSYERLQKATVAARGYGPFAPAILQDLFWSFYKAAPTFSSAAPSLLDRVTRDLLAEIFQTREWQELRATGTSGDALMSAMGAIALSERLLASLDEATRERMTALYQAEQEMQQLLASAAALQEAALDVDLAQVEQLAALSEQRMREVAAQVQIYAPLLTQVPEQVRAQAGAIRQATRQALRETIKVAAGLQQSLQTPWWPDSR